MQTINRSLSIVACAILLFSAVTGRHPHQHGITGNDPHNPSADIAERRLRVHPGDALTTSPQSQEYMNNLYWPCDP